MKSNKPAAKLDVTLLLDRIIVKPVDINEEKRESGIIITKEMKERNQNLPRFGRIIAAGPGDPLRGAMAVKEGDLVSFLFYSGTPFEFNGSTHLIMREHDVIMIINE